MAIKIIKAGAFYAGAPLQVGEVKTFSEEYERYLLNLGVAEYLSDGVSPVTYADGDDKFFAAEKSALDVTNQKLQNLSLIHI